MTIPAFLSRAFDVARQLVIPGMTAFLVGPLRALLLVVALAVAGPGWAASAAPAATPAGSPSADEAAVAALLKEETA